MNNNYILYGAASIGNLAMESLKKCAVKVIGYIDRRAFELSTYNGLPVWDVNAVPEEYVNEETYIYISVKNVFEHEKIANMLYSKGFRHIIYKPYSVLLGYGNEKERIISEIYDKLFEGIYDKDMQLPICQVGEKREVHDFAVVNEEDNDVIAYIPTEFIYTNDYQGSEMEKWGNICIPAFFTHIDFFRFLSGDKSAEPQSYLREYCIFTADLQKKIKITDAWQNNVIENRSQIYEQMKDALDLDPEFFIRNAAEAEWNDQKKIFNLSSGKHRCTFQTAVGKKYLPLKISKKDYEKFLNKDEVENTMRLLYESDKEVAIPHPYFYRGILARDRGDYQFLLWFARYYGRKIYYKFGKVDFERLFILDWTNDCGHFARFCTRMGCKLKRMQRPTALEEQLNRLFYSDIEYGNEDINKSGNIIIIEADNLKMLPEYFLNNKNTLILKDATENMVDQLVSIHDLCNAIPINAAYLQGRVLQSFLFEETSAKDGECNSGKDKN